MIAAVAPSRSRSASSGPLRSRSRARWPGTVLAFVALVGLAACEGEPPGETQEALPGRFEGTAGIVDVERPAARVATLREVRVAEHDGFDRVVFEFEGPDLPGHHVEYVDRPVRRCGSGLVAELAGDGWLEVRMSPVRAHTEQGEPTVQERERRPGLPVLLEIELTCDFEAVVTWVLGVSSPNRYRAVELDDPPRLVIDVRHSSADAGSPPDATRHGNALVTAHRSGLGCLPLGHNGVPTVLPARGSSDHGSRGGTARSPPAGSTGAIPGRSARKKARV